MIVVTLSGGIGNQLFMYAAARALALQTGTKLVINETNGFEKDFLYSRKFELEDFHLPYITNNHLSFNFPFGDLIRLISRKIGWNLTAPYYTFFRDRTDNKSLDKRFFSIKSKNVYLEGYWQSEMYFKKYSDIIRQDLKFNFKIEDDILREENSIFSTLKEETPVCIGVRTYQECKQSLSFNITNRDFYLEAMDYIAKRVKNPIFYVFSQDVEWVKENLISKCLYEIRFINKKKNNNSTLADLYLMSKFKYHIISNSSYYWWGAWLSESNLVISNKNFINEFTNCPDWIVL